MDDYIRDNGINDPNEQEYKPLTLPQSTESGGGGGFGSGGFGGDDKPKSKSIYATITPKSLILSIVILGILAFVTLVLGVRGLAKSPEDFGTDLQKLKKGECVEYLPEIGMRSYALKYTHTMNFIPYAKEYYYLIGSEDGDLVFVRASKDFGDHFDAENENKDNFKVKGVDREFDYKAKEKINEWLRDSQLMGGVDVDNVYYIDLMSGKAYYMLVACGIICLLLIAFMIYAYNVKNNSFEDDIRTGKQQTLAILALVGFIAFCYLMIVVVSLLL